MRNQLRRTHRAELDLVELAEHLEERQVGLGVRFLDAAEATCKYLLKHPALGSPCGFRRPANRDMRVWKVQGFRNHLIYYREVDDGIQVVRVLHAARDVARIFGEG